MPERHTPFAFAGKTMLERMEWKLDELVRELKEDDPDNEGTRGMARGLVWCIAVWVNPYAPDMKATRKAANLRYEANKIQNANANRDPDDL